MTERNQADAYNTANLASQLEENGFYVSTTVGYSMWPMLKNRRDRIVLRALEKGEVLKKGDVPLYCREADKKYILHRILRVEDGYYIIRGDNTFVLEKVPFDWVKGVLTEFYRKGKQVSVNKKSYRFYACVWQGIYPIRLIFFLTRRFLSKVKHKIFKSKKH